MKSDTLPRQKSPFLQEKESGTRYAQVGSMIFDTLGSGPNEDRRLKGKVQPTTDQPERNPHNAPRPEVPHHNLPACAISGPALLQTEQVLMRRAPELVLITRQIRNGGAIVVQSGNPEQEGTFNLYQVSTSPESCKMVADALAQTLEAQRGHPASLRVLVNIWRKLEQEGC